MFDAMLNYPLFGRVASAVFLSRPVIHRVIDLRPLLRAWLVDGFLVLTAEPDGGFGNYSAVQSGLARGNGFRG